jgi:hypothetical protein
MVAGMAEAGQCYDEPLHGEEEGHPHQDALTEIDLGGITPCRWDDGFNGQNATQGRLDDFWGMWQRVGTIWHVWQVARAPEGVIARFVGKV